MMMKTTIAIMHFTCPPVVGGVEKLIAIHAGLYSSAGYPTRVITGKGEQFHPNVPVTLLPALYSKDEELLAINRELESGIVSERFHQAVARLEESLAQALEGVDVCIVHNAFTLHFNLPLTAALHHMVQQGTGPRFVAWCHDLSWCNELYIPSMRDAFPWRLLKEHLPEVDYVVVSDLRRTELARIFGIAPDELKVITAGVDPVEQLKLEPDTMELVERLGLLDADILLLAPVRITKRKNLELAIRIVGSLRERGVRAKLVVTGPPGPHNVRSGDYVDELRRLRSELKLEKEVVLLFEHGRQDEILRVSDETMYDLYGLSDLLLFTSAQEGFGIPILEAGLHRLPVFCSDIPPFKETGLDQVHYFGIGDPVDSVAGRIVEWMHTDRVYRLRRRVLSAYSWRSIFADLIEPLAYGR